MRPIRLRPERYSGRHAYFVTACCHEKAPLFDNLTLGHAIIDDLTTVAAKHSFVLPAYCAMPNHLHLLAVATLPSCNLLKFVSYFKQKTAHSYQREHGQRLWQPRYFEHILREASDFESVALYIWNNPVRAGICARAIDYELSGSTTIDWKKRYGHLGEWKPPWKGREKQPPG